ncbi:unnamed protein product [Blepharisma stoltei]|uniref:3'-5' exonuclease domain-containing protein n=1 Tax=Blepharisma stoltei TaxID=1481888 RepID=A0AAU9KC68_9CILI|nr:unnamed protein product [Blepharisma stoltei]
MGDKPFYIGESLMYSPVLLAETASQAIGAVARIMQMSTAISLSVEIIQNDQNLQISCITIHAWNGPVYIFDLLSGGVAMVNGPRGLRALLECPTIMKIVFNCQDIAQWLWKSFKIRLGFAADAAIAYKMFENIEDSEKLNANEFSKKIENTEIPFWENIKEEITVKNNKDFWKQRPLLYHMHSYLSGYVILLIKGWDDVRGYLNDEQVYQIFQNTQQMLAKIYPALKNEGYERTENYSKFEFKSNLNNFTLDRISVEYVLNKILNQPGTEPLK